MLTVRNRVDNLKTLTSTHERVLQSDDLWKEYHKSTQFLDENLEKLLWNLMNHNKSRKLLKTVEENQLEAVLLKQDLKAGEVQTENASPLQKVQNDPKPKKQNVFHLGRFCHLPLRKEQR